MWRKLLFSLLLLGLIGTAVGAYVHYSAQPTPLQYTTAAVERGNIATTVNATGIVDAVITMGQLKSATAQVRLAEAQVSAALAQVEQSKAALQATELDLQHTTIRSPVNGIVIARNVDVGQTVAASLQAPTLFIIAQDLTRMQVDTNVSEADIGRMSVGQKVTFTVDAYPGTILPGQVVQVRHAMITCLP